MPALDFTAEICDEVASIRSNFGYPNAGTAFGHFVLRECVSKIMDIGDVSDSDLDVLVTQSVTDGKDDNGIDAVFVGGDGNINLFQFKFSSWNLYDLEEFMKTRDFLDALISGSKGGVRYNSKLSEALETKIKPALENRGKIAFHYVGAYFEQDLLSVIGNLKQRYQNPSKEIEFKTYDYALLKILLQNERLPKNKINLAVVPGEFFVKDNVFFHLEKNRNIQVRSLVGSICAQSLHTALEDHSYSLFHLNVRFSKGFAGEINKSIIREYEKGDRSNFWFLNNGINAICRNFEVKGNLLHIDSLQIVNGCQTCKALLKVLHVDPSISVLFRLTEIKDTLAIESISDDIAVSSNRQNPISNRDLHANDSIQRDIFKVLEKKNIFYDHKEGSWKETDKKNYKVGKYKWNKIKNVGLAISCMSFYLQTPVLSKGREKIAFSDEAEYYSKIFDDSHGTEKLVKKLMLAYRLRELVDTLTLEFERKYPEFLTVSSSTDIMLALLAMPILKMGKLPLSNNIVEIETQLKELKLERFINEDYNLEQIEHLKKAFELIANNINLYLLALKSVSERGKRFNSTNWLKTQEHYQEILAAVIFPLVNNTTL
jgi:hypothetical protein